MLLNISLCHRPTGECLGFEAEVLISVLWVSRRADWGMLDSSGGETRCGFSDAVV